MNVTITRYQTNNHQLSCQQSQTLINIKNKNRDGICRKKVTNKRICSEEVMKQKENTYKMMAVTRTLQISTLNKISPHMPKQAPKYATNNKNTDFR